MTSAVRIWCSLWYLNRMNGYVTKSVGHPVKDYDDSEKTEQIDGWVKTV